jgi:hypothetical protein
MAHLTATTYHELINKVPEASTRVIGNNTKASHIRTTAEFGSRYVDVTLHDHRIITLFEDGIVEFTMCGYGTVTTRERLNHFLVPLGFRVSQSNYQQILTRLSDGKTIPVDSYGSYTIQNGKVYRGSRHFAYYHHEVMA